jgi:putative transposase
MDDRLCRSLDWWSRKVLAWRPSNTMEGEFCVDALEEALARYGQPEIPNSDQGSRRAHFDGRQGPIAGQRLGRTAMGRSRKYECVYLQAWSGGREAGWKT